MATDRIVFEITESKTTTHAFKVTPEILNDYNAWLTQQLELTDNIPTEAELYAYFKKINTLNKLKEVDKPNRSIKYEIILIDQEE
jgi:hypothetical protein